MSNYKSPNQTFDQAINDLLTRSREHQDLTSQLEPIKQQLNLIMNQIQILQLSQLQQKTLQVKNNQDNTHTGDSLLKQQSEISPIHVTASKGKKSSLEE